MPKDIAVPRGEMAYLLPGFDEYVLGYKDRSATIDTVHGQKIIPGNNGMFLASIVINGKIEGLWKKTVRTNLVRLQALPFTSITALEFKLLKKQADIYGHFIGTAIEFETAEDKNT